MHHAISNKPREAARMAHIVALTRLIDAGAGVEEPTRSSGISARYNRTMTDFDTMRHRIGEAMRHRIGARGILIGATGDTILLALEQVTADGREMWVPPGGGLEPEDGSLIACLRREFREETGLEVEVGPLLYAREFSEPSRQTHHLGLYFLVHSPRGERHPTDRASPPQGADTRRHTQWFTREELESLNVRPEYLRTGDWTGQTTGAQYLGVGHEDGRQAPG